MFSKKKFVYGLLFGVAAATLAFELLVEKRNAEGQDTLVVGMMSGYPPFMSLNESGQPEGFDVDVANEIGQRLGKKIVIKDMGVAELLIGLQQKKIDVVLSGLSITKERQNKINMIYYQGEPIKTAPLLFWKEIPAGVNSLEDLRGKNATVCVEPGSSWENFLAPYTFFEKKLVSKYLDMVFEIRQGKALAALFDPEIVGEFLAKFPELKVLEVPLGDFSIDGNGIGIGKDNPALTANLQKIVTELRQGGTISALENKWFKKGAA
jgi:ABC-type amino acid transport substrate-binding protein